MISHQLRKSPKLFRWFWPLAMLFSLCFGTSRADSELQAVRDLVHAGEYLTALTLLEDFKDLRPCDADLLFLQARVYEAVGETDTAISLYHNLIDNFPSLPEPYNNLAVLYAAQGKIKKAKTLLNRGLSTNDSYQRLQKNLTTVYVVEAAEAYRRALGLEDQQEAAYELELPTPRLLEADALLWPSPRLNATKLDAVCRPRDQ